MTSATSANRHWPLPVIGAVLTAIALGWVVMFAYLAKWFAPMQLTDFQVYRDAVASWLGGADLYDYVLVTPQGLQLPFTYPPFAALLMVPSTWLPLPVGWLISVMVQLGCLLGVTILLANRTDVLTGLGRIEAITLVGAGWLALAASEPALHSIELGQVSLILIAVVLVDATVMPPRWRGLLIGLAAAIKLTPGIFLLYFVATRQWRAAINTALTGVFATAIGFLVLPAQSWRYWTFLLFDTSRVGDSTIVRNKSLLGLLAHLGLAGQTRTVLWLLLAVVVVAVGLWRVRRTHAQGASLAAVITVGIISTVVSPVSWPHHLVWLPLAGLYLAFCTGWRRWLGLAILVAFVAGTPLLTLEAGPTLGWTIAGDTVSVVLLIGALVGVPGRPGGEVEPVIRPAARSSL